MHINICVLLIVAVFQFQEFLSLSFVHCQDSKGVTWLAGEEWNEMQECNKCHCVCGYDFQPKCTCTKKICQETNTDGSSICEDRKGITRLVGEKWKEKRECNKCDCYCKPNGKTSCACTWMGCQDKNTELLKLLIMCRDYKGFPRNVGEEWNEKQDCNQCHCVCTLNSEASCGCTKRICKNKNMEGSSMCKDIKGITRKVGKKWIEKRDCNKCYCICKPNGKPSCACTKRGCQKKNMEGSSSLLLSLVICKDKKGIRRIEGEKWNEKYDCNNCHCVCKQDGKPRCGCTKKGCVNRTPDTYAQRDLKQFLLEIQKLKFHADKLDVKLKKVL